LSRELPLIFPGNRIRGSEYTKYTMAKPHHIGDLERRQRALEEELSTALLQYSTDDLMIADLKRRIFHLRDEIDRFRHEAARSSILH
jgi:hypothetical protein